MSPARRRAPIVAAAVVALALLPPALLAGLASAQLAPPPPTPIPPDGALSPFPQSLHTPASPAQVPSLTGPAAALADLDSGQVLFAKNADVRRPIASVTKIMTALIVLRQTQPSTVVTVGADAVLPAEGREGIASLGLHEGERITVGNLLYALLLQSANDAAVALADEVSGSVDRFVTRMNAEASRLGMRDTRFRSPNGLDDRGYSSARDLITLTRAAYALPGFAQIVATKFHSIPAPLGSARVVENRNSLLWLYPGAIGVKTGYTSGAGYCVVGAAQSNGRRLVAVVLGAPGDAFSDAAALLNYGFAAFTQHTFATTGDPVGVVSIRGGSVLVQTRNGLAALVPTSALAHVRRSVLVDPRAAYPPAPGERVATLKITIPGLTVGRVPLVVATVPPPPPGPRRSWWVRAASAVAGAVSRALGGLFG